MKTPSVKTYLQKLNLKEAKYSLISHNDAMVAIVYKIWQSNGKQLILKICDRCNDYLREIYFLDLFKNVLPVPKIVQVVEPKDGLHGAILMECLPGTIITELNEPLAYDMGRLLAQIHLRRTSNYGDLLFPSELKSDPSVPFIAKFEEGLEECSSHLSIDMLDKCRKKFKARLPQLDTLDGPCIIHRDFRPGNLIACEGQIQGIIDWSSARSGFAEEDFYFMEQCTATLQQSFLKGYGSIRPVPHFQKLIPLLKLNKAIATIGFLVKRNTWQNNKALYQFHLQTLKDDDIQHS